MSDSHAHDRRRARTQIRTLFPFTTRLLSIVLVAAPGRAAVVCTHSDATVTAFVTLDAAGDTATIGVVPTTRSK
jgi:hypothetical protein